MPIRTLLASSALLLALPLISACGSVEPLLVSRTGCQPGERHVFVVRVPESQDLFIKVDTVALDTAFDPRLDVWELAEDSPLVDQIERGVALPRGSINNNAACSFEPEGQSGACFETRQEIPVNSDVILDVTAVSCSADPQGRIAFEIEAQLDAVAVDVDYLGRLPPRAP